MICDAACPVTLHILRKGWAPNELLQQPRLMLTAQLKVREADLSTLVLLRDQVEKTVEVNELVELLERH